MDMTGNSGATGAVAGAGTIAGAGGAPTAGAGGADAGSGDTSGAEAGAAGSPIPVSSAWPSPGCARELPANHTLGKYIPYSVHVSGKTLDPTFSVAAHERGFYVWLPTDYDVTKPNRVTFLFMGCGDRNAASTATYKLMAQDPESVYVAMNMPPAGFPPAGKDCYDSYIGKQSLEWEFMGLAGSFVQQNFCVDENQLFVAGYSSGATVSNMLGCYFAGHDPSRMFGKDISVRGQASVTGTPVQPDVPCGGKVAAFWLHDTDDKENVIAGNQSFSLPRVLAVNECTGGVDGPKAPWGATADLRSVCQQYTSCPSEYPVIFCTSMGRGHSAQDDRVLPGFIGFEDAMNAH